MPKIDSKFFTEPVDAILQKRGLEKGGEVQKYIDNEVLRLSTPYVPFQTGNLANSGIRGTNIGSGLVVYDAPYARFQYYGVVMVGETSGSAWANKNERKVTTDKPLTYHGGGKRGKMWFERMKADHKQDILRNAAKIAGGKAK